MVGELQHSLVLDILPRPMMEAAAAAAAVAAAGAPAAVAAAAVAAAAVAAALAAAVAAAVAAATGFAAGADGVAAAPAGAAACLAAAAAAASAVVAAAAAAAAVAAAAAAADAVVAAAAAANLGASHEDEPRHRHSPSQRATILPHGILPMSPATNCLNRIHATCCRLGWNSVAPAIGPDSSQGPAPLDEAPLPPTVGMPPPSC